MSKKKPEVPPPEPDQVEQPAPPRFYPDAKTDLAGDNLRNDTPSADLEDL